MATPASIKSVLMGSGKGEMNLAAVRSRAEELRRSIDQLMHALSVAASRVQWSDALERYGVLNVQWQQLEEELRPLLKHYVAHPISVNQSNAHVLPILLASKALPEMEARDAELLEGLHAATGTSGLPPEQQLALIMEHSEALCRAIDGVTAAGGPLDPRGPVRSAWQRRAQATRAASGTAASAPSQNPASGGAFGQSRPRSLEGPALLLAVASYGHGL
ncbi:hypothetical protein F751_6417 [Auxenochlorella protothecoides]|uniref:Mediator of RNA polymerase II transcription subunit 8 n=2 Tax=Auxenochlorella protothecoides TaxID=3075 RepID=A0A087SB04_AUXPR|nr:hypothetical protein F751_6417 [Auxenochlorella protothecoides]KFM22908.1 hypothetical protein F751_6417 [Auxenochlorella protothecoides]